MSSDPSIFGRFSIDIETICFCLQRHVSVNGCFARGESAAPVWCGCCLCQRCSSRAERQGCWRNGSISAWELSEAFDLDSQRCVTTSSRMEELQGPRAFREETAWNFWRQFFLLVGSEVILSVNKNKDQLDGRECKIVGVLSLKYQLEVLEGPCKTEIKVFPVASDNPVSKPGAAVEPVPEENAKKSNDDSVRFDLAAASKNNQCWGRVFFFGMPCCTCPVKPGRHTALLYRIFYGTTRTASVRSGVPTTVLSLLARACGGPHRRKDLLMKAGDTDGLVQAVQPPAGRAVQPELAIGFGSMRDQTELEPVRAQHRYRVRVCRCCELAIRFWIEIDSLELAFAVRSNPPGAHSDDELEEGGRRKKEEEWVTHVIKI